MKLGILFGKASVRSMLRTAALNSALLALMFLAHAICTYAVDHWMWTVTRVFVTLVTLFEAYCFLQVSKNPKFN